MIREHIYRLVVEYPEAAYGDEGMFDRNWEPENWDQLRPDNWGAGERFFWPSIKKFYLSRSGAKGRAELLRRYGATVAVQKSEPLAWNDIAGGVS